MYLSVVVVLAVFTEQTICISLFPSLGNQNLLLPESSYRDFTYSEFEAYLDELMQNKVQPTISFPRSLVHPSYTLTGGQVNRFYDPVSFHGSFNRILMHQLNGEFYGVTQIFGPKIDFSFNYQTGGKSGRLSMIVSHLPLELQLEFGTKNGDVCKIKRDTNDVYFQWDDKLETVVKPDYDATAQQIVQKMMQTWLPKLYKAILRIKFDKFIKDAKRTLLEDPQAAKTVAHICKRIQ